MQKRILCAVLTIVMMVGMFSLAVSAATPAYNDIQGHWAQSSIERWSDTGVVSGKGNNTFDPDGLLTRAEAAQIFSNLLGLHREGDISAFTDVKYAWYKPAIAKCYGAGIIAGKSNTIMDPNGNITRQEFFTMFTRAIDIANGKDTADARKNLSQKGFKDASDVANWAADSVDTLVSRGYVNGITKDTLAPQTNINRASVMKLLDRAISVYAGKNNADATVAAGAKGITLIASPAVTKITGDAEVLVIAAGAEDYNATKGEISHKDIILEGGRMSVIRLQGENITATLTKGTTDDPKATGINSGIIAKPDNAVTGAPTFKAVYDATSNTLTFYYDAYQHNANGTSVILYDNLPTDAMREVSWPYYAISAKVKHVVIDKSVAEFHGLTSTAGMLEDMRSAESISGTEYLDVSKVTDMSFMFGYFGFEPTDFNSVPDISNWDTSNVVNMSNMFMGYGYCSKVLDFDLDLTGWDVSKVTNADGMFSISAVNTAKSKWNVKIPYMTGNTYNDVDHWYIGNGTDTDKFITPAGDKEFKVPTFKAVYDTTSNTLTFYYDNYQHNANGNTVILYDNLTSNANGKTYWDYHAISTKVKHVVIDKSVAEFHGLISTAGMLEDMQNAESISGTEYLDVSNVTNMNSMFKNFGSIPTNFNSVPDISNWDTSNVVNMSDMFTGYGYCSKVLNFNLNLTGWDVSKVTDVDNMFLDSAINTTKWNVKINYMTGTRANDVDHWYIGNGTDDGKFIQPAVNKEFKVPTFKAVYDTTSNILTFYYDDINYSKNGITVYDKLPTDAMREVSWDYHAISTKVKHVVIDKSVAEFHGLTSTAGMLEDMRSAESISGTEYLDVSNVTDMSFMFGYFGFEPTDFNSVPDISNWDISNVVNMSNMFMGYGYCSKVLDFNLDLTGWDVSKVTNADGMFSISAVNTAKWNVKIPHMTGMKTNDVNHWYIGDGFNADKFIKPAGDRTFTINE